MLDTRPFKARILSNQFFIGAFATIGGGLFGLDISSMSAQLTNPAYITQFGDPGATLQGGIVAAMPGGSFAGALVNSYLSDRVGRRYSIMIAGVLWIIGSIIQSASYHVRDLIVGRVISGLSVGIASSVVPIYISELTKPGVRGRVVALQQWAITWGIFFQFFVQYGCSFITGTGSFRLPWALQMIPAILLVAGMVVLPESPRWLMDNGRSDEALRILADVHGAGDASDELVQLEYNEIKQAAEFDRTLAARSYMDLVEPRIARRVWIGASLQMWSQLCGMNVMMYYVVYVFQSAGITGRRGGLIASSVQWVLNVVMTVPAIIFIDRWGRRPMLLIGAALMCMFLFIVGALMAHFGHNEPGPQTATSYVISGHTSATYGIIVCSYFFVCSFACTWGPVSWTYPAEIFPTRVRAKAVSLCTAVNWAFNFALSYFAPPALATIQYKTYFVFGTFCAAAFVQVLFTFPETCGRTLEEMDAVFEAGNVFTAWRVEKDVGRKTLNQVLGDIEHGSPRVSHGDEKAELQKIEHKQVAPSV